MKASKRSGESETFDTSLDNDHKCIIYGTIGGSYKGKDVVIDVDVDNSLVENLYFADGSPVQAMPENYYTLAGDKLNYGGTHLGGVEVQLTDAFFADPDAIKNTYVIPVVMTDIVKGADQIKSGTPPQHLQLLKKDSSMSSKLLIQMMVLLLEWTIIKKNMKIF